MKALLIIPAFNEGVKLAATAERVHECLSRRQSSVPVEPLIVDDASTDGIPQTAAEKFRFHYLRNPERRGVGHSIRRGYEFGLERGFAILAVMAGNNKDNPAELDRLIEPIASGRADFVQGSRYLAGGEFGNMPLYRVLATRCLHPWVFSIAAGRTFTDTTNGFRALRASLLEDPRLERNQPWLDHYEFEPYLFLKAIHLGYRVTEVPVTKIYPEKGLSYSKVPPLTGWWSMLKPLVYVIFRIKR